MKKTFICLAIMLLSIALFSSCSSNESSNGTSGSNNTQHAHAYSTKVIAATCSEQGYTLHTCPCGDVYKDNYKDVLGHSWISGEKNYYCSRCNKSEADDLVFILQQWMESLVNRHCRKNLAILKVELKRKTA